MKRALILIDIQNDFLPGGALPVQGGDQIFPQVDALLKLPFDQVIATQDWHPHNHCSFTFWPPHCIQNTPGAEISRSLKVNKIDKIIFKGTNPSIDSYSAFFDNAHQNQTELDSYLKTSRIDLVVLAGLTTDYCVKYTALDALDLGYRVVVAHDACRALGDPSPALQEISQKGGEIATAAQISNLFSINTKN